MEYGPRTRKILAKLDAGQLYNIAGEWNPDVFSVPFPERLAENISDYYDLPLENKNWSPEIYSFINGCAKQKKIELARTTLNAWMKGERDPSVSSSDQQTRENIYKLCAALNYDYEQTIELFGKVFFTRAFNPKNRKELAFRFFAQRDYENGIEGSSWFQKGERVISTLPPEDFSEQEHKAITKSELILDKTALMEEEEFAGFLASNAITFVKKNENVAARNAVKTAAMEACRIAPGIGKVLSVKEIPYETLIGTILGYTQRNATMATGTVSSLQSLPPQFTTNFPTGQILRRICLDEECTYDQVNKMLSLLLFFRYFSGGSVKAGTETGFREFLRFANMILDRAGCTELYPQQPYGGFLLFCAAQKNPLLEFRKFLKERIEEESEAVLQEELKKNYPAWKNSTCLEIVRAAHRDPFSIKMIIGTFHRTECLASVASVLDSCMDENLMQFLYENANFSEQEKSLLRAFSLLPPSGISDGLFDLIFCKDEPSLVKRLQECSWVNHAKSEWSMDYRIRSILNDQLDFPNRENCKAFIQSVTELQLKECSDKEKKQLDQLKKRIKKL